MRRIIPAVLILCLALPSGMAMAESPELPRLEVGKKRYLKGQDVRITIDNDTNNYVSFDSPWRIVNTKGESIAAYHWEEDETTLAPGDIATWVWDGTPNECSANGCTKVGGIPAAGRYFASVQIRGDETLRKGFLTGRYFTLGFESRPKTTFKVFVAREKALGQMRAEAKAEEKSLIVSGIVRLGRLGYNSDWSFYMAPRSIVTGEVFIEVCDGSPYYVQRHRKEWNGDRWCPWSSYVKRMGR